MPRNIDTGFLQQIDNAPFGAAEDDGAGAGGGDEQRQQDRQEHVPLRRGAGVEQAPAEALNDPVHRIKR